MATSIKISDIRGAGGDSPIVIGGGGEWISLKGSLNISKGGSETYEITDYDDFSTYTVSSSVGTAVRTNENITVNIPGGAAGNTVTLTVTRNATERKFIMSLDSASIVSQPSISSPLNGEDGIDTTHLFKASAFKTVPAGAGTHTSSTWEIADDAGFSNIIKTTTISTGNKTQWNATDLPEDDTLYVRVKYTSSIGDSVWSDTVTFNTIPQQSIIAKPTVNVSGGTIDVGETPTFTTSVFSVTPAGTDSHVATTWILRDDGESIIWQRDNSTSNKTSLKLSKSVLSPSSEYTIEAQHIGSFGVSVFSNKTYFSTKSDFFPTVVGEEYGGGYYVGRIDVDDGNRYALILSPRTLGGQSSFEPSDRYEYGSGPNAPTSRNNGKENTNKMLMHPPSSTATWATSLNINGYSDWYIPSMDELGMCYRNLKPTSDPNNIFWNYNGANPSSVPPTGPYTSNDPGITDIDLFRSGGAETLLPAWGGLKPFLATSTQKYSGEIYFMNTRDGHMREYNHMKEYVGSRKVFVRAVRRELIGPTPV